MAVLGKTSSRQVKLQQGRLRVDTREDFYLKVASTSSLSLFLCVSINHNIYLVKIFKHLNSQEIF